MPDPHPTTELAYQTPFELLISVILSARQPKERHLATGATVPLANTPRKSSRSVNPDDALHPAYRPVSNEGEEVIATCAFW